IPALGLLFTYHYTGKSTVCTSVGVLHIIFGDRRQQPDKSEFTNNSTKPIDPTVISTYNTIIT
ncbi:MAG: hypothetical protein IJ119_16430, partial [Clostridia bacterium]|nr:hypothetical protein [Clostridia bacterium]